MIFFSRALCRQKAMKVVDAGHNLAIKRDDDIAAFKLSPRGRPFPSRTPMPTTVGPTGSKLSVTSLE